ncbi:MAG: DUF2461 domain-containing protein [Spirosomataceae bacterium]
MCTILATQRYRFKLHFAHQQPFRNMYTQATFDFLQALLQNNNREWFQVHKADYEKVKKENEAVVAQLIRRIGQFENLAGVQVKDATYRINRDIRFSPDKSPYKGWLASSYSQGGRKSEMHGYYLHIQPGGESGLAAGMYAPSPEKLARFRQEIDYNPQDFLQIIEEPDFVRFYGKVEGNELKSAPKGYEKDHPQIELIRKTQCYVWHRFSDDEVLSSNFLDEVERGCRIVKPFIDWLNQVLHD